MRMTRKPRRNMVEHLADRLADQVQRAATAGAGLMLDIEPDVLAGQMRRQARPLDLGLRCTGFGLVTAEALASTRARSVLRSSRPSCS